MRLRLPLIIVCAAMAVYAATFSAMGILQHRAGTITYVDTATFEEMLWRTVHGRLLVSSDKPHMMFGSHIQFNHLFLLPVYLLYPSLPTLMVCETVALALGALPVYALALHVHRSRWLGVMLAVAYLLYTPMQFVNLEGGGAYNTFRPIAFAVPCLLAAFYYLARERWAPFWAFAALVLYTKQEFGLILFMLGLYMAAVRRRPRRGLGLAAFSLLYVVVTMKLIIPAVRGSASHTVSYYAHLGGSWEQVVRTILVRPGHTLGLLFGPRKLEFWLVLFFPVGFLCLLDPLALAVSLPTFAMCLLSGREGMWLPVFHYHAPIVPCVLVATVYGIRNLARLAARARGGARAARRVTLAAGAFVLLCSLGTNVAWSKSPLSFRFHDANSRSGCRQLYVASAHARKIPAVVAAVPRHARVSASVFINTHFTHHAACYVFPGGLRRGHLGPADHVVLDFREVWPLASPEQREAIARLEAGHAWEELPMPEGFRVFRRLAPGDR